MAGSGYIKSSSAAAAGGGAAQTVREQGYQFTTAPADVVEADSTGDRTSLLAPGRYFIYVQVTTTVNQGGSSVTATVGTDRELVGGTLYGPVVVTGASDGYIAVKTDGYLVGDMQVWPEGAVS